MTAAEQRIIGLKRQLRRERRRSWAYQQKTIMLRQQRDKANITLRELIYRLDLLEAPKGPEQALRGAAFGDNRWDINPDSIR